MLKQKNGDGNYLADSCALKVDQTLCGEGSRTAEQDSKDTAVGKTIISESHSREILSNSLQNDSDEKARQGDGSARIEPAKEHPSHELNVRTVGILPSVIYDEAVRVLSDDANGLKKNIVCGGQSVPDSCLKCGKSGQLLRCCSCPLAAHDSCFGNSLGRFDDGQFYCPVCFYSKAAEAYKKAEKTLSEARKNLSGFFGWKRFAKQQDGQSTGNQQRVTANCEDHDLNSRCTSKRQGNHRPQASNLSPKDEHPGHEKTNAKSHACPEEKTATFGPNPGDAKANEVGNSSSSHEVPHSSQNGFSPTIADRNIEGDDKNGPTNSPMTRCRQVRFEAKETAVSNSYGKASGCQDQYVHSPARRRYYPYPPDCYSTPARSPLAPRRKSFVSTARRTRLLWTAEEEAALREALARFAPKEKGQISWVQIREHGNDVFHPTRLPNDLRQKWNYMKKRDEGREGAGLAGLDARSR